MPSDGCAAGTLRDLIKVVVNVTASRKIESLKNVRVSMRSGPVRPGSSYKVYLFELRDRICVSMIIPPKSQLAEIIEFATQVWAISRASALVSSGFCLESIAHMLTVENFR